MERVPGSNELPVAAHLLARTGRFDVVVALGVLIRGDTIHYELIADAVTHALQTVALESDTPVINGVIVAENQATSRGPLPRRDQSRSGIRSRGARNGRA